MYPDMKKYLSARLHESGTMDEEKLWDWGVNMCPLDLATLPELEQIAPSFLGRVQEIAITPLPVGPGPMDHFLPPMRPGTRLTLVLDLDETLVHFNSYNGSINFRPYVLEVLRQIKRLDGCEVVVFTAGTREYAESVLERLGPDRNLIDYFLSREHCCRFTQHYSNIAPREHYWKELRHLGRPMDRVVLVDNSPTSLVLNPSNGIPIKSWLKNPEDRELLHLLDLVKALLSSDEPVQSVLEDRYNLPAFFESLREAPHSVFLAVSEA